MESYEDFIRTQLSRLDRKGSGQKLESPCRGSSVIRFHGLAILPPLLTVERREEMLKYRTDAQGLDDRRIKPVVGRRMLHLRELLDSVQLRKAPTLREFIGDEPLAGDWERGHRETGGGASQEVKTQGGGARQEGKTQGSNHRDPSPLSGPSDAPDEEPCDPSRPLTSTARGSPTTGDLPEFHSPAAEVDVSAWDARGEGGAPRTPSEFRLAAEARGDISHRSASSGYATHDNTEVTAGQTEVTEGHVKVTADQTEVTAFHTEVAAGDMVVMAGHLVVVGEREGEREGGREGAREGKGEEEGEGRIEAAPESFFLHSTSAVTHKAPGLHGDARPEGGAGGSDCGSAAGGCLDLGKLEPEPPNGPHRMSLQNLLKRSQEYRQRQRQLRGARTRGPGPAHRRSDKENQPGRARLRKARDRRLDPGRVQFCATGTVRFDRPVRTTTAQDKGPKSLELLGSGETKICEEERSGASTSPQGVPAAHGFEGRDGTARPQRAESPPPALKALPLCLPGLRSDRFGSAPSPQFCTSPIRSKRTGRPARKLPVNTVFGSSSGTRGHQSRASEGGAGGRGRGRG
ncbi:hypothetical protein SKAU_G00116640 [Synaphobranchus kaupii]|uniref:Uncharacterized protein n=1 Tax=Synaphobranchus kaupii TaxID=118154 RepID=A0A9Q1FMW5_SYNKA|nr:hypothetical protein SKAU_G00116640 [Synaphobranchus kaupii]